MAELTEFEQVQQKVSTLRDTILEKHPRLPGLLSEILTALQAQPENVLLLSPDEIGLVVQGIEVHKGTFLAASVTKPAAQKSSIAKIKVGGLKALGLE
jgi:DNA polymerase III psi subunit